jgi:hypothetical protein
MSFSDIIGSVIDTVGSSVSDVFSTVTDTISGASSAASAVNLSGVMSAISSVGSLIGEVSRSVHDFIDPIAQVIHGIGDTINQINDGIIKPIVDPIRESIAASSALVDALNKDLGQGLQGILQIPQDITNAVNSMDSVMQRTVMQLGALNTDTAKTVIAPAMDTASHIPLMAIHDYYSGSVDAIQKFLDQHQKITLTDPQTDIALLEKVNEGLQWMSVQTGIWQTLGYWFVYLSDILPVLERRREPALDLITERIRKDTPTGKLPASDAAAAYVRGILSLEQALDEIRVQNFSLDRAEAIIELSRTLLGVGDLLSMWHRKKIGDQALNDKLAQLGINDLDAELLAEASYTLPDPTMVLDWRNRALVSDDEAVMMLGWNGFHPDMIPKILAASPKLMGIDDAIIHADRMSVWRDVLHVDAPDVVVDPAVMTAGRALGLGDLATTTLWVNHFQMLGPSLACQAWFRGSVSQQQLHAMLSAAAIPSEMHATYIELQRPLIPFRTIPAMLAAGIIDEITARRNLEAYGYTPENSGNLLDYALSRGKTVSTAADNTLHGLTQSTIVELYRAGSIQRDEALSLLTAIGIADHSAALTLQLEDVRAQAAERKAETDLVIAQAESGQIDFTTAQSLLSQLGLTTLEIEKALAALLRSMNKKLKTPSESQLTSMWKHGIIDDALFHDTLVGSGYSEQWAQNLMSLAGAAGASTQGV